MTDKQEVPDERKTEREEQVGEPDRIPPIDFASLALDHATNVMEMAKSGDLRQESPSKHMITDAAMIQLLERIANSIERIESVLVGISYEGPEGVDIT